MARVEIRQTVGGNSAFAQKVAADSARLTRKRLDSMSEEVVTEVNSIISQRMVTDRDPSRRKAYQRHLLGSIVCDVEGTSFPIELVVHSLAEQAKVASLEEGATQHFIQGDPFLYFPATRAVAKRNPSGRPGTYGKRGRAKGSGVRMVKLEETWHPGNIGYHFMRDGLRRVVERRLRSAR